MRVGSGQILFETSVPVSRLVGEFPGGQQLSECWILAPSIGAGTGLDIPAHLTQNIRVCPDRG